MSLSVLALVPDGATAEVLLGVGGGWVVDPTDGRRLRDTIIAVYDLWARGRLDSLSANPSALEKFSRERLAGELAAQFDVLAGAQ